MVQINFGQREVSCKVVFYGPGMSGKTTNLEVIHKKAPKDAVGEMVSIATETDRTLYFDFLPLDLGQVAGMRTKFQLYTVPGQIYYNATRKLVLQGVDGVIFVADSSPEKMPENLESMQNLRDNLAEMGLTLEELPLVIQYNKRDLPSALPVPELNAQLNPGGVPTFEGVARDGKGVFATLKEISRLVIEKLNKENAPAANRRRTNTNLERPTAPTPAAVPSLGAGSAGYTPVRPQTTAMPSPAVSLTPAANRLPQRSVPPPIRPLPTAGIQQQQPSYQTAPAPLPPPPARDGSSDRRAGYSPSAPTPAHGTHVDDEPSPRDRHLSKAKPPALDNRRPQQTPNLGSTDPNLRKYQQNSNQGGGALRALMITILALIILAIVLGILVLFVPAVRAQLPQGLQRMLAPEEAPAARPSTATEMPPAAAAPKKEAGPKIAEPTPKAEAPRPAVPAHAPSPIVGAPPAVTATPELSPRPAAEVAPESTPALKPAAPVVPEPVVP